MNIIFFNGPSFNFLLNKKLSMDEKKILYDIYYAKLGNKEHQYQRATKLVTEFVFHQLIIAK